MAFPPGCSCVPCCCCGACTFLCLNPPLIFALRNVIATLVLCLYAVLWGDGPPFLSKEWRWRCTYGQHKFPVVGLVCAADILGSLSHLWQWTPTAPHATHTPTLFVGGSVGLRDASARGNRLMMQLGHLWGNYRRNFGPPTGVIATPRMGRWVRYLLKGGCRIPPRLESRWPRSCCFGFLTGRHHMSHAMFPFC